MPLTVPLLRKLYLHRYPGIALEDEVQHLEETNPDVSDAVAEGSTEGDVVVDVVQEVVSESSDHVDIYVTIGSWTIESLAYIAVGLTKTLSAQLTGELSLTQLKYLMF